MSPAKRQMSLIAFLQAQNCSNYPGSWRHPETMQDFLKPQYYQRIARNLEDGRFHLAFSLFRFAVILDGIGARAKAGNAAARDAARDLGDGVLRSDDVIARDQARSNEFWKKMDS